MSEISKMNPEVRDQWIKDLRSGEYKKVTSALVEVNGQDEPVGYCALGVLCDQAVKAGVIARSGDVFGKDDPSAANGGWDALSLPSAVRDWAGLKTPGVIVRSAGGRDIPGLNDAETDGDDEDGEPVSKYTFDDIAGFIEADAKLEEVAA